MPGNSRPRKFTRAANNNADNVLGADGDENEDEDDEIGEDSKPGAKDLVISRFLGYKQRIWPRDRATIGD